MCSFEIVCVITTITLFLLCSTNLNIFNTFADKDGNKRSWGQVQFQKWNWQSHPVDCQENSRHGDAMEIRETGSIWWSLHTNGRADEWIREQDDAARSKNSIWMLVHLFWQTACLTCTFILNLFELFLVLMTWKEHAVQLQANQKVRESTFACIPSSRVQRQAENR